MNILLIASNSSLRNGASRCLLDIVDKIQHHRIVVVLPSQGELCEELQKRKIQYHVVKQYSWVWYKGINYRFGALQWLKYLIRKYISNYIAMLKVCSIIHREQIDLVHLNTLTTYVAAISAKRMHVPYIWHIREFLEEDLGNEFVNPNYSLKLINDATQVICISNAIKKKYETWIIQDKLQVIYDGVCIERFRCERDILQSSKQNVVITLLGRFTPTKGQFDLIQAINIVRNSAEKTIVCKCVGDYEDKAYVDMLYGYINQEKLERNVTLCNYVANPEIILRETDILCVCSDFEAFGLVTVEGMMSGCLVIGSNSGCTKEIIRDGSIGLLYEKGNVNNLADKILYALNNSNMVNRYSRCGQKEAFEQYGLDSNISKIAALYDSEAKKEK